MDMVKVGDKYIAMIPENEIEMFSKALCRARSDVREDMRIALSKARYEELGNLESYVYSLMAETQNAIKYEDSAVLS